MKNKSVAALWAEHRPGRTVNVRSDGKSLWSHDWYEIARHVGSGVVFIRHEDEGYSQSTRQHIGQAVAAAVFENKKPLRVRGADRRGINAERMGQPDWSWLSLCWWFDNWRSTREKASWPGREFLVRIRSDADTSGRSHQRIAARLAQRDQELLALFELCEDMPGFGLVSLHYNARGQGRVIDAPVPLEWLDLVNLTPPPSSAIAAKYRAGPKWFCRLFWAAQVEDIRYTDWIYSAATAYGEPPEPILPFWPRILKKAE